MHLPTKIGAEIFIQSGCIKIFPNSRWRLPASWIFNLYEFGTFRRVNSVVLELCTRFRLNIYYNQLVTEIDALLFQTFIL